MSAVNSESVLPQLNWRYATKKFDATKQIPNDLWQKLEQSLVLSPSSFGLQPWKFIVVEDKQSRAKLRRHSWNQPQIEEASHLVVFTVKTNLNETDVERHLQNISSVRGVDLKQLQAYGDMMKGFIQNKAKAGEVDNWSTRQLYIALGFFLSTAAMLGVDTCPMEGIDADAYDQELGLKGSGYHSVVVATAGYRASSDDLSRAAKVRFPANSLIERR
jgi:nitroreductase